MAEQHGFWHKYRSTIVYGISLALLMFLLKWLELRFIIYDHSFEIYVGFIAFIFTGLGIWLALKLSKPKVETIIIEKQVIINADVDFTPNAALISQLDISSREMDVLNLMAKGHSNAEIARELFISLSTVKTHTGNLFVKLDVKRRTQAIEKAKRLQIIP
ncbi:MAG TPA: LuxR C-terminal-related transcriptional regulator [Chitinophagales bacterium]|nr:LuxR C-terminal-related transcriptional regulator [Chitinophagales bacterium]HMZ89688.1 LuxR C-terminal-related transcriptional regulator [Chitinophagales bacterium]HNA57737.1 LuxR C-terminal-related transcriptional regulator [Chitinophagales bacterium]HNF70021.1 LuxR C-terminal-related transcriptional regulator [Chitinophagales bacterium]HNI55032.1 LuxR C-terminal-related transcriptional regulator [Chitinophagales bacterium]